MILSGKPVADALRLKYAKQIDKLAWKRTLTVWVDEDSDQSYLKAIQKAAKEWKINVEVDDSPEPADMRDGIACCIPKDIIDISGKKKVELGMCGNFVDGQDMISDIWAYRGECKKNTPCTAEAIMRILDFYEIPLEGRNAVIIGRSDRVGKPVAMLMLARNNTITVCHSHTPRMELNAAISRAGIIVCASGYKDLLDHWMQSRYMDSLQTVVNVGGDYDEESVWHKTSKINLVPYRGGVGPVTAAVLMSHVLT